MEDKLRQIFDNLNEEEIDELIKPEYEFTCPFDEERIKNMVFEKTGVLPAKKKKFHIDSKFLYLFGGMAAGFLIAFSVFLFTSGYSGDKGLYRVVDGNDDNVFYVEEHMITDQHNNGVKEETGSDNEPEGMYEDRRDDGDNSDNKNDSDKHDKNPHSSKSTSPPKKPPAGIAVGKNGRFTDLSPEKSKKIFEKYSQNIDMSYFKAEYDTVEDMVSDCDFIVKGIKKSEKLFHTDNKSEYYLCSRFEISSVIWQSDEEGSIGNRVIVKEGVLTDEHNRECIYRGGYVKMNMGKEYILFLKYSDKGYYKIAGTVYGKLPMDEKEAVLDIGEENESTPDIDNVYTIVEDAREQYKNYTPDVTTAPQPEEIDAEPTSEPEDNEVTVTGTASPN